MSAIYNLLTITFTLKVIAVLFKNFKVRIIILKKEILQKDTSDMLLETAKLRNLKT